MYINICISTCNNSSLKSRQSDGPSFVCTIIIKYGTIVGMIIELNIKSCSVGNKLVFR